MSSENETLVTEVGTKITNCKIEVEECGTKEIVGTAPTYDMLGFASPRDYLDEFKVKNKDFLFMLKIFFL